MNITNKQFYKIQPLLLSIINEPEINCEKLINGIPDDIGELPMECFIKACNFQLVSYNAVAIISCFTQLNIATLSEMKCKIILPTYIFYAKQIKSFVSLLENLNKKYEVPAKFSIQLNEDYGWFGIIKMLSNGDLSKHAEIIKLPLYDCIASIKYKLDSSYSEYQKMKQTK